LDNTYKKELVEVGSQKDMGKAPQCSWSPIPPLQLRGEPVQDLTTNSGFVSFGTFCVILSVYKT